MKAAHLSCLVVVALLAGPAWSQDQAEAEKPAEQAAMEAMMAEWAKYANPGEHHAHLAALVGSWKTTSHKCCGTNRSTAIPWSPCSSVRHGAIRSTFSGPSPAPGT